MTGVHEACPPLSWRLRWMQVLTGPAWAARVADLQERLVSVRSAKGRSRDNVPAVPPVLGGMLLVAVTRPEVQR